MDIKATKNNFFYVAINFLIVLAYTDSPIKIKIKSHNHKMVGIFGLVPKS